MLRHDNLQWRISLTLCCLCVNGVTAAIMKPDILEALGDIAGYDLTDKEMRKYHIWPQGIIPYYIDDFSFDKVLRDRIRSNLDQISKVTGLRFNEIPKPPEDDENRWVFFLNRKALLGCDDVSYSNFTNDGVQKVVLGYDCINSEDLAGIILSLVGVAPQHNSPDRDDYITVNWDNILKEKHYLFKKMEPEDWMFSKLDYDFASAGHYNTHKYTLNGAETVSPKNQELYSEGGKGLSAMDVKKIRTIYNFISYKGQNNIKVPECSKLFVTGSNFSNYKPSTKSDLPITELNYPTPSGDLSSENTTNSISNEANFNESSESRYKKNKKDVINKKDKENQQDSKGEIEDKNIKDEADGKDSKGDIEDKNIKDEADNKDSKGEIEDKNIKDEADGKDSKGEIEDKKIDDEADGKDSKGKSKDKKIEDEADGKDNKGEIEDKNTEDKADSKEHIKNENLNLDTSNDTKKDSGPNIDNASQQQTNSPESKKLNGDENKSLEKNVTFLKSEKNRYERYKSKQLLSKSDYETGDEGNNDNISRQTMHFQ